MMLSLVATWRQPVGAPPIRRPIAHSPVATWRQPVGAPPSRSFLTRVVALLILFTCLLSSGCGPTSVGATTPNAASGTTHPLAVVATVGMVADPARQIGGDAIEVRQLMGAGVDPHLYKANRDDVRDILRGDLVLYSGLMLEGKMTDALVKAGRRKSVFAITDVLDHSRLSFPDGAGGHPDPHVWMDVAAWSQCAEEVSTRLIAARPEHAEAFRERTRAYRERLAALHAYGVQSIGSIPESRRILVTSHDAFHYFGRAYGLEVLGVQGISTESEAGLRQINQLVEMLVRREVPAVFVESSVPRKSIETLIRGAAARGHVVTIGGELFSDAMGEEGTYEGTYEGMLDHNITLVTRSLGGDAPPRGLHGKLAQP